MAKKIIALFVGITLLLAGCLTDQEEDPEPVEDPGPEKEHEHQMEEEPVEETPPLTPRLTANVTNGTAPLEVSFQVDANNTDDRNVTWTLDLGYGNTTNGTDLPATVNITLEEVGNFTATLNVTAGEETAQTNVTITVNPPASAEPVIIEGTSLAGHPGEMAFCARNGIDGDIHEIAPAEAGWFYEIAPVETFSVYWWSEPSPIFALGGFVDVGADDGTVPEGATHVEICLQTGHAMEDYVLTLWDP